MRHGVCDIFDARFQCRNTRKPLLSTDSGNLVIRFHNTEFDIITAAGRTTALAHTVIKADIQKAIADREIQFGRVTLRFNGDMAPDLSWAGDHVRIEWPRSRVHVDVRGVPNFLEPYLIAVRLYPGGTGDCIFSNQNQSVDFKFES